MNSLLGWQEVRLENYVDLLTGFPFKSQCFTDASSDIPLVKGANVHQGFIDWDGAKRWSASEFSKYIKFQLQPGDVVVAMDRPWIEAGLKYAWIRSHDPKCLLVQRVARLRGTNGLLTAYLKHLIGSPAFTDYIKPIVTGVNIPHISADQIRRFKFFLPPLPTQHKIAAILSAYDRLIENNTRRIKILEEMARSLYDEWFVKFRFPGHEQVKMVDSELGLIPEGWELRGIGEIIETVGGGTPSTKNLEYWEDGNITWYTPSDLTSANTMFIADSEKRITALGLQKSSARMFPPYSVMMTSRATIGVTAINTKSACTNQGFITCIPNEQLSAYQIYFWVIKNVEKIISLASGATFKEINKTTFRKLPIVIAAHDTRQHFVETLNPLCKQVENLQNKNTNLCRTRDLLLPKLISGEIDVEDLDINTGEIAT